MLRLSNNLVWCSLVDGGGSDVATSRNATGEGSQVQTQFRRDPCILMQACQRASNGTTSTRWLSDRCLHGACHLACDRRTGAHSELYFCLFACVAVMHAIPPLTSCPDLFVTILESSTSLKLALLTGSRATSAVREFGACRYWNGLHVAGDQAAAPSPLGPTGRLTM